MKKISLTIPNLDTLLKPWLDYITRFASVVSCIKPKKSGEITFSYGRKKYQITQEVLGILSDEKRVKKIILVDLEQVEKCEEDIRILHDFCTPGDQKQQEKNSFLLSLLFNYDDFKDGECFYQWESNGTKLNRHKAKVKNTECYCAQTMYANMDLQVCPYCNLEYIPHGNVVRRIKCKDDLYKKLLKDKDWEKVSKDVDIYTLEKKHSISWEFDHFYPQSQYPYLSISVNNLIPVCHICNQRLKRDLPYLKDWYIHPFFDDFDQIAHFEFDFRYVPSFVSPKTGCVLVSLHKNPGIDDEVFKRAQNYCDFFALRDINTNKKGRISLGHSDYLCETLLKCQEYSWEYIENLQQKFIISKKDVERLIFGNYTSPEDINKRPLSKVTIDMIRQFGHLVGCTSPRN